MTVICRAYTTHEQARDAAQALIDAGVPGADVRVLTGEPARDASATPNGGFAGEASGAGDFAGREHVGGEGMGSFAAGGPGGRGGSFADADRETLATYPEGVERRRVAGHRRVRALLMEAGLDAATAQADTERLHQGAVLLVADIGDRESPI